MNETIQKALNYHLRGKQISSIQYDMDEITIVFEGGDDLKIEASREGEIMTNYNSTPDYDLAAAYKG